MPTKQARLMVNITHEQDQLLAELGQMQGRSKASFLREMLDQTEPLFRSLLTVIKAHKAVEESHPITVKQVVAEALKMTYGEVDPAQIDLEDHLAILVNLQEPQEGAEQQRTERSEGGLHRPSSASDEPSKDRQ